VSRASVKSIYMRLGVPIFRLELEGYYEQTQ